MHTIQIFPSLISADLLHLQHAITTMEPHCDGFHIDVMDNHFVPNLTWGSEFITAIVKSTTKQLHIHLMVEQPLEFLKKLSLPPKTVCSFHIESEHDFLKFIKFSKEKNLIPSIAIKPKTPLRETFEALKHFNHVLLLSVEPGFSGQQLLASSRGRLQELIAFRTEHDLSFAIAMDGGINETNIGELAHRGATQFAVAQGIYGKPDPIKAIENLYKCTE